MPILEADELASLRADLREVFVETEPDVCDVQRGTAATNAGDGTFTETPNLVEEDVPCSYKASSGNERQIAGATQASKLYTVKVPAGTDVEATDTLLIHAKGDDAALTLQVVTVLKKSNALKWSVLATEG